MKLFLKKEKKKSCCCQEKTEARIKILGSGCAKCKALEGVVLEALEELKMYIRTEHITDFSEIAAYGVMTTPALVVDNQVVSYGRILKKEEVKAILQAMKVM